MQVIFELQLYKRYGIHPSIALTSRTAKDEEFDPFLATPEEARFRAQLLEAANKTSTKAVDTGIVELQAESIPLEEAFKILTPVVIKHDGEWDVGMIGHVAAHPDDTEKEKIGSMMVYIDKRGDGTKVRQSKWVRHEDVRRVAGTPTSDIKLKISSIGETTVKSEEADAFKMGFEPSWPECFVLWQCDTPL